MRPTAPPRSGTPALDDTARIGWGLALRLMFAIGAAVLLGFLLVIGAPLPDFLAPVFFFLLLRILGDGARAFAGARPAAFAIEGHAKAAAWAVLGIGLWATLTGSAPLWVIGAGLTIAGLSLWGHHVHVERASGGLAIEEGALGAVLTVLGLAAATTVLTLGAPWHLVVPFAVLALGAAFGARAVVRLTRRVQQRRAPVMGGLGAWYQEHFFRLTLLAVALLAYVLFVRAAIRGFVPLLFLFEYSAAVLVLGFLLWSLRGFLSSRLVESPIQSPRRRHEQAVERQGETAFDQVEDAFGRFLELGDPDAVAALAQRLRDGGVPRADDALAPVAQYRVREDLLLIDPAWLYGARLANVALLVFAAVAVSDAFVGAGYEPISHTWVPFVLGIGLFTAQWNRYGGHWAFKTGLAYAGLLLLLAFPIPRMLLTSGTFGLLALGLGIVLPLLHPLRARSGRPTPRFAYRGSEPLDAIERLRTLNEGAALRRLLWTTGIGIVVFFVVGEMSRFAPALSVLFTLYLVIALLIVLGPVLTAAGLRVGRAQVQRRHQRERAERIRLIQNSLPRLDQAFAATGQHGGALLKGDAKA